jgi:hypothetical protein
MFLLRFITKLLFIPVAALVGNFLGDQARTVLTGEEPHAYSLVDMTDDGETVIAVNPVMSNFLPAVFLGLFSPNGVFWAFVGGFLTSAVIGNRYEDCCADIFDEMGAKFNLEILVGGDDEALSEDEGIVEGGEA